MSIRESLDSCFEELCEEQSVSICFTCLFLEFGMKCRYLISVHVSFSFSTENVGFGRLRSLWHVMLSFISDIHVGMCIHNFVGLNFDSFFWWGGLYSGGKI